MLSLITRVPASFQSFRTLALGTILMACSFPLTAHATSDDPSDGLVQSAGGIVEPAFSTALLTNPAGLIANSHGLSFTGQAGSNLSSPAGTSGAGGLLYAQPSYGIGAGLRDLAGNTSAFYGMAAEVSSIQTSFGISGYTGISPSGGTSFNAGIRSSLSPNLKVALESYGLGTFSAWGGGISYQAFPGFHFLSDFACNGSFGGWEAQPGIRVGNETAALSMSYGISSNASPGILSSGFAAGAGLKLSQSVVLQAYYNELMTLYAALTLAF